MAQTKQQNAQKPKPAKKAEPAPPQQPKGSRKLYAAAILVIAAVVIAALAFASQSAQVPFSTFKSSFSSAPRVSVAVTYSNLTQYNLESPCFSLIVQIIAHSRKASTIDFFLLNQQNSTCTYSKSGLGGSVSLATANASYCTGVADSEPGIFLNFSKSNYTSVTSSHAYVYGNAQYMSACPIAVELS